MADNMKAPKSGWRVRVGEKRSLLFLGDLVMAIVALGLALYLWSLRDAWALTFWRERVAWWYYLLPFVWLFLLWNLSDPHKLDNLRATLMVVFSATVLGGVLYAIVYLLVEGNQARIGVGFFLLLVGLLTLLWRFVSIRIFTAAALQRRVLILGAGKTGETLLDAYLGIDPPPFQLVGFIDDDGGQTGREISGYGILATSERLLEVVRREKISDLVIAVGGEMEGKTFQAVLDVQEEGVEIVPMAVLYEELLGRVPVHHLESEWLIRSFVIEARPAPFYELLKRLVDIMGGIIGVLFLALITPFISLGILLDSGAPVIYSQMRAGKGGHLYRVWKFRSMVKDAESNGVHMTVVMDERITRLGRFLRRTHLDEFPQFLNVLRGEMSIVGPRAERPELIPTYEKEIPFYRARLLVPPGITGWAQVNYEYTVTIEEVAVKLEYDLYYIKHRNLLMDLSIILRTLGQVFAMRGR